MKKTRMAMLAVALVAGMSSMVFAQRGGGRGGGGARIPSTALMMGITLSGADSAKIKTTDSVYTAARTAVLTKYGVMGGGGGNRGGGGANGGGGAGGGRGAMVIPDSVKAQLDPIINKWELDLRADLSSDAQKAAYDANKKTYDPYAPPARGRGGFTS